MSVAIEIRLLESTTAQLREWMTDLENSAEELDPENESHFSLHVMLMSEMDEVRDEITRREEDPELDLEVSAPVELTVQEKYLALFAGR